MSKLERAKKELHLSKLKTMLQEKELKILERLEDIDRIKVEIEEYNKNIKTVESQLQGSN